MSLILENQEIIKRPKHWLRRFFKQSKGPFKWLLGGFLLCGAAVLIWERVLHTSYFTLQKIEVAGSLKELTHDAVVLSSRLPLGKNIFNISLDEVEKNVLQLPWVMSVSVRRETPHTIWIYVKEQKPKALLLEDTLYFVSENGVVFKEVQTESQRDLPVLTGLSKSKPLTKALQLIKILESNQDFELFGLSEIHYNDVTGFSVVTLLGPMEIKLGKENFESKINRLKIVWPELSAKLGRVKGIDLDYEDKVFVKL